MTKFKQIILSIILVFLLIFSWQIAENVINANRLANNETGLEAFIPSPLTIIHTFTNSGSLIVNQSLYTFSKAMLGFGLGVLFAILMALYQLGVAAAFVQTLFTGFVVALALASGLAFGLGGKDTAARVLKKLEGEN